MEVAKTILKQSGGNKFIVMTGAKQLTASDNALGFKIGRNASKSNYVKITLNSMDLYDMQFIRLTINSHKIIAEHKGIYNDMLRSIFTKETGLYTSLR